MMHEQAIPQCRKGNYGMEIEGKANHFFLNRREKGEPGFLKTISLFGFSSRKVGTTPNLSISNT
jgi:hypothetical protein